MDDVFKFCIAFILGIIFIGFILASNNADKAGKKACKYGWEKYDYNYNNTDDVGTYTFYCRSKPIIVNIK